MNLEESIKIYNEKKTILKAVNYVYYLNSWDIQTEAPQDSIEEKNKVMDFFSELEYKAMTSKDYVEAVNYMYDNREKLDKVLSHEITKIKEENDKIKKIPQKEFTQYLSTLNSAYNKFVEAKKIGNYDLVKDDLAKIITYKKNYIKWQGAKNYNILLDEYEKNSSMEMYDKFFDLIKQKIVPLIKQINEKKLIYNRKIFEQDFDIEKQKQFSLILRDILGLNPKRYTIKESEHPFTTNFTNRDVRTTNHYYKSLLKSAIFSDIHEMGHALYELNVSDEFNDTMSGGGTSMAMHESQSRFMENLIGRNYNFWLSNFNKLKELFLKELENCTLSDFYNYINEVGCDFIRTEADELTYPIHVCIRYEIEKGIFENKYTVDELPKVWNKFYKDYLGIEVKNDTEGILQDMHWYGGDFGYFPTYALGTAYACQIYNAMNKDFSIDDALKDNKINKITEWLKNHIHIYGSSKDSDEILYLATGEKFNPNYYIDYLLSKYKKLYDID